MNKSANARRIVIGLAILAQIGPTLFAEAPASNRSKLTQTEAHAQAQVRAIFEKHCFECHGATKHKSGLRLDSRAAIFSGSDSGAVIQPSKSESSLLYRLVAGLDPEKVMPPKKGNRVRLTKDEIQAIKNWIDDGARWDDGKEDLTPKNPATLHWAFKSPTKGNPPAPKNLRWVRNEIDRFILTTLDQRRWEPSPEADKSTQIRRLTLDLTGLLPTTAEFAEYLNDNSAGAYERMVDRLLNSPHFGERWGRHWLDLARYADSEGYQVDTERPYAYVYRNWVIQAINDDMPYDRFTIEQIAGDLLPNATLSQKIGVGFHRNTLMNHEDGVDAEEFRCKAKVDRVSTTGTVWLGLTLGCAECHSHKYDPVSQKEFYQLYAFFNNADEVDIPLPASPDPAAAKAQSFVEKTNAPSAFVHVRGDFLRKGEQTSPWTLAALQPFHPRGQIADRLDLARWLVQTNNPLTARVEVNRIWQQLFGRGLVNTPEDFGNRGEPPSHPELLDWLACTFMEHDWSRKQLIRLIVTSSAYRQSSHSRPELQDADPENRYLARQNRFREDSEVIRDAYLCAGGLLNGAIGGKSFRPFLPADVKAMGGAGAFTWTDDLGPVVYRRGMYIYSQRTVPYPVSMTFDAPDAKMCCARRDRSNTPLQALTLLNHPIFVECANGLANRMAKVSDANISSRVREGFRIALSRDPTTQEMSRLLALYEQELRESRMRKHAQTAALISVAQVLLNLDEFITRE